MSTQIADELVAWLQSTLLPETPILSLCCGFRLTSLCFILNQNHAIKSINLPLVKYCHDALMLVADLLQTAPVPKEAGADRVTPALLCP